MAPSEESRWFAEHVQSHEPALRAYLSRRFASLPDHDDLIQETYSRAMRAWKAGRITHARGFLFTAARNIAIDLIRRHQRRDVAPEDTMLALEDERPAVQEQLDQSERLDALVEAVDTLPPRCREVMILRYVEGLSYREIADRLSLSPETVKVHLVKGVRDCIRRFHQRGILDAEKVMPITS